MSETVCIVGAGLSGLTAARTLCLAGHQVVIVDKGKGLGGRLATRRIGDARLDHGAQFFTVRGEGFRSTIDEAMSENIVDVWCHGFSSEDGYPRYYCPDGMTALAKWLGGKVEALGGRITLGDRVSNISTSKNGEGAFSWRLPLESGGEILAQHLIATPPVPQTLELLEAGNLSIGPAQRRELAAITYVSTIAVLVTLDGPPAIAPPGGIQQSQDEVFTFIADNQRKGVSATPAVTFHTNRAISKQRWHDSDDAVLAELLEEAKPWLGDARVVEAQLKKWKYAGPEQPHDDRCFVVETDPGLLVLAGDAFGGPKVEGAFNSGEAAAQAILS